jgi:hypothetical protein
MIMAGHVPIWRRLLNGALSTAGSWITIGVQDVHEAARHEPGFDFPNLTELLQSRGIAVETLDWFDPRADHRHDLNLPLPEALQEQFDVLLDIGTIEHVFDTRQVFINYLSLVKPGGDLCLHLPVSGYYRHGLHTFSPDLVRGALFENGCEIFFTEFTDFRGQPVAEDNLRGVDALLWIVARKTKSVSEFRNPQQIGWQDYYGTKA